MKGISTATKKMQRRQARVNRAKKILFGPHPPNQTMKQGKARAQRDYYNMPNSIKSDALMQGFFESGRLNHPQLRETAKTLPGIINGFKKYRENATSAESKSYTDVQIKLYQKLLTKLRRERK